tara:strand:- start:23 stop:202 length:180 start_codon:yes stop_codon:yes gene_type:complete
MGRDTAGTDVPSLVERFIQHQRQVVLLQQMDGCCRTLDDRSDVFVVQIVHDAANFTKRP